MRNLMQPAFIASALILGLVIAAEGQEWTRFRGPNGSGIGQAAHIPVRWTADDYLWRTRLPGKGHSSPVVWGQRLFLLSADPADATRYVLCLDTETGDILWQKEFASQSHHLHLRNSFASSTPAVDQQHVYVTWATPEALLLTVFDHQGNVVWKVNLGRWASQHGYAISPILYDDLVILSHSQQPEPLESRNSDGLGSQEDSATQERNEPDQLGENYVVAFDRITGQLRWKTARRPSQVCYSTPCIYSAGDGPDQLICYSTADGIYSLDPNTGEPNWSVDVFTLRNVNSPIVVGDLIFGSNGSGGGGNYLVAIDARDEPREVYRITRQAPYVPTPVAWGELVFLFSDKGIVTCIEASDGHVVWRKRLSGLAFSGSPIIVDGRIYCIDEGGTVIVLAATRSFTELARNPLGEPSRSTPAVAGERMFLRTESQLFCVGQ